jgi:hypothetical protein
MSDDRSYLQRLREMPVEAANAALVGENARLSIEVGSLRDRVRDLELVVAELGGELLNSVQTPADLLDGDR